MNITTIAWVLWNNCNALHDESMSYGNYVEQLI